LILLAAFPLLATLLTLTFALLVLLVSLFGPSSEARWGSFAKLPEPPRCSFAMFFSM
jgi:hypothetical protein